MSGRFTKGQKGGPGRPKGLENRATKDVRAMIAKVAEQCAPKFIGWLDEAAAKDPAKAADLYLKAIEYHIPKLARTELTGAGGGAIVIQASSEDEKL